MWRTGAFSANKLDFFAVKVVAPGFEGNRARFFCKNACCSGPYTIQPGYKKPAATVPGGSLISLV